VACIDVVIEEAALVIGTLTFVAVVAVVAVVALVEVVEVEEIVVIDGIPVVVPDDELVGGTVVNKAHAEGGSVHVQLIGASEQS
jgi:hypothetical protein